MNLYLSLGCMLLAYFPTMGNTIALITHMPRRMVQAVLLAAAFSLCGYWILKSLDAFHLRARFKTMWRNYKIHVLLTVTLSLLTLPLLFFLNGPLLWSSIPKFICFVIIVGVMVLYLFVPSRPKVHGHTLIAKNKYIFGWVLMTAVWTMALVAWIRGPLELEVLSDLGGSTILLGSTGCALGFIGLTLFSPPIGWLIAIPGFYLMLMSTARTGMLLFFILSLLIAIKMLHRYYRYRRPLDLLNSISAPLIMFSIFFSISLQSRYFPYYSPNATLQLIEYRQLELTRRISRLVRVFGQDNPVLAKRAQAMYAMLLPPSICDQDGKCSNVEEMARLSTHPEVRWTMLKDSWEAIESKPFGHWPEPYENYVKISCSGELLCSYPHNAILEIGFYFGILAMAVALILLLLSVSKGVYIWVRSTCPQTDLLFVIIAGLAMNMQLTGQMLEHFAWMLIMFLATLYSEEGSSNANT